MALDPTCARHAGQIAAGTSGRNKGHAFEHALTVQIRELKFPRPKQTKSVGSRHLREGDPATELVQYIIESEQFHDPTIVSAHWLGGLATSGLGDRLCDDNGVPVRGSKSDVVIAFKDSTGDKKLGVSVKTCFNDTPTNDQLFCSTATAFCNLLRGHQMPVSNDAERAMKMFCGDPGYRPMDNAGACDGRISSPERWFWEELPQPGRAELEALFESQHGKILKTLLRDAYANDPFRPDYVMHLQRRAADPNHVPLAIYSIDELVALSEAYKGFELREYKVNKGRFKSPVMHLAPRFGIVQFQQLGNTQNRNQLQFNLEAGYFNNLP